jgi:hypothetical protein
MVIAVVQHVGEREEAPEPFTPTNGDVAAIKATAHDHGPVSKVFLWGHMGGDGRGVLLGKNFLSARFKVLRPSLGCGVW